MNPVNNIGQALPAGNLITIPLPFLVIILLILMIAMGAIHTILWYHWQRYSEDAHVKNLSLGVNFIVSFIFFISMVGALLSYSSGI